MTELTARELLVMLYETALDAVDGRYLAAQWCQKNNCSSSQQRVFTHCVAIGKAAAAMLQGVLDNSPSLKQCLLICPPAKITRQLKKNKNITCLASSHPIPDERSIEAGQALIEFLSNMKDSDELLLLISGGTSSLVEVPVDNLTLQQLQQINNYLLSSGKDIHQVNAWRQQFSQIKGGGLLDWIKSSHVTQLLLSDVKDDRPEFIGSGLLVDVFTSPETDDYLSSLLAQNQSAKCRPEPAKTEAAIHVDTHIIGNIKLAMQAVHQAALAQGLNSFIHDEFIEGDAAEVARHFYEILKNAEPGIHVWGGETTVCLPEKPGIGGRNQTLALAFAQYLVDRPGLHLLAAGTDGIDGNSNCAGAVVSMFTAQKAVTMGFDIKMEIEKANAGIVLMATDDLLKGMHSNTNVMDIYIAYKLDV
jgi:hydroxypyruvate reductase